MHRLTIAHELGHAIGAETQDGFWYPSGLSFEKDDNAVAYCYCEQLDTKKPNLKGPYTKVKQIMNLGGIFGELLYAGYWHPWGARGDIDEFISANSNTRNKLKDELDDWYWLADDDKAFRAVLNHDDYGYASRGKFVLDCHDTARRLPLLWEAHLDFCDRISKEAFKDNVIEISKTKETEIGEKELKKIIEDIVL